MKIKSTKLEGVFIIDNFNASDERGSFIKTFNSNTFKEYGLDFEIRESYYSVSKKNVIRGMHFQKPPHDHQKIVICNVGSIIDVVMDIRHNSSTYGKCLAINLKADENQAIYIPKGFAHGFQSLEDNTSVIYFVTTEYNKYSDSGILWNSINFDWEIDNPIISSRDSSHIEFINYKSDFKI